MALINRIARLFKADFHAVLDRIEEPEQLLKQAVREMDEVVQATEHAIKVCAYEQQSVQSRKQELGQALAELDQELDLCFASKKDDLARGLVRKKLETQRLLKGLSADEQANEKFLAEQRAQLDENRSTLESLKQKAEIFAQRSARDTRNVHCDAQWLAQDLVVSDSEIEVAFLREQNARRVS
ncbi:MAG: PspA/IM30 family protein [Woeseiaceae bacterium]|nr:PspA/IM30 family protein [Woeseiaceae bacterium]